MWVFCRGCFGWAAEGGEFYYMALGAQTVMTGNWALKHILLFLEIALLHWFLIKCYLEKTRYNLIQYHVGYKDQMNSVVFLKTSIKAIFLIKGVAVIWGLTTDDFSLCCKNWCLDVCVTSALDIGLVSCTLVLCGFVPYEFTHKVRSIPAEVRTAACFEGRTDILLSSYVPSCQDIVACFIGGSYVHKLRELRYTT